MIRDHALRQRVLFPEFDQRADAAFEVGDRIRNKGGQDGVVPVFFQTVAGVVQAFGGQAIAIKIRSGVPVYLEVDWSHHPSIPWSASRRKRAACFRGKPATLADSPFPTICLTAFSVQLLLTGVPALELDPDTAARFKKLQPGGFILFGRNIQSPEQLRKLIDDLRDYFGH